MTAKFVKVRAPPGCGLGAAPRAAIGCRTDTPTHKQKGTNMKQLRPYQQENAALALAYSDTVTTPGGQLVLFFRYGQIANKDFWRAEVVAMGGEGETRKAALARLWAALMPAYPLPHDPAERDAQLEQFARYYKAKVAPFLRLCGKAYTLQRYTIPLCAVTRKRAKAAKARAQYFLCYHLARKFGGRTAHVFGKE